MEKLNLKKNQNRCSQIKPVYISHILSAES